MAVTSTLVPLGTPAPEFSLSDLSSQVVSLNDFSNSDVLVVAFLCNHCPYVRHIEDEVGDFVTEEASTMSMSFVGICSNDVEQYPDDDVEQLVQQKARAGWGFPYLVDTDQTVARAYGAVCTPDFFVYGSDRTLAYRGAFDESTPGNDKPVSGDALRSAVSLIAAGSDVPEPHKPSMGCSIKWRTPLG
jgi:peroxiredoxin